MLTCQLRVAVLCYQRGGLVFVCLCILHIFEVLYGWLHVVVCIMWVDDQYSLCVGQFLVIIDTTSFQFLMFPLFFGVGLFEGCSKCASSCWFFAFFCFLTLCFTMCTIHAGWWECCLQHVNSRNLSSLFGLRFFNSWHSSFSFEVGPSMFRICSSFCLQKLFCSVFSLSYALTFLSYSSCYSYSSQRVCRTYVFS
jgi:hypothetical protein